MSFTASDLLLLSFFPLSSTRRAHSRKQIASQERIPQSSTRVSLRARLLSDLEVKKREEARRPRSAREGRGIENAPVAARRRRSSSSDAPDQQKKKRFGRNGGEKGSSPIDLSLSLSPISARAKRKPGRSMWRETGLRETAKRKGLRCVPPRAEAIHSEA